MATVGIVIPAYRPNVDVLSAYISVLNQRLAPTELRVELDAPFTSDTVDRRLSQVLSNLCKTC